MLGLALSAAGTPCYILRMRQRDAGLLRTIGTRGLAANVINSVIGAGIFAVPGALAACIGPYAPLAFLVCGMAVGAVAICFVEGGSRMPTSGGPYGYVEAVFGPLAGYIAGTILWVSNALACGGVAAALADVAVSLLPPVFKAPAHAVVIVGVIGGAALINMGGVSRGARLVDLATAVKLIPLLIFLIAGITAIHRANFVETVAPSTQGLGRALILALFVLTGMGVALSASGEVKQPARAISRALGRVHPRTHVPHVAILCYATVAIGLALTGTFAELAVLATLGSCALYAAGCIAAWRLAHNGVAQAGTPLNFRWLGSATVVGVGSMLLMIALAARAEILGLLAMIAAGATVYLVQSRTMLKRQPAEL